MKDLSIREAQAGDAAALCAYMTALIAEDLSTLLLPEMAPTLETEQRFLQGHLDSPNSVFLIGMVGDRLVGQLRFAGAQHPRCAHSGTIGMSVDSAWRGQRVGTALLEALFKWVESHPRVWRVELEVLANNPKAQRLYARSGFRVEGTRRRAVQVDGEIIDAVVMSRLWPPKGAT